MDDPGEEMERIELQERKGAAVDVQGLCGRKKGAGATVKHVQMGPGLGSLHPPLLFPCPSAITVPPPMQQGCPRRAVCRLQQQITQPPFSFLIRNEGLTRLCCPALLQSCCCCPVLCQ